MLMLSSADFFQHYFFSSKFFSGIISVLNSLDLNQAKYSVGPDLCLNCFQQMTKFIASRQRIMVKFIFILSKNYMLWELIGSATQNICKLKKEMKRHFEIKYQVCYPCLSF